MEGGTTTTLTARLPILNPGEYDLWLMRIEQYFLMTDYSLWEVILNGNKVLKRTVREVDQIYEPTSAEEKQDRRNEMKARVTLLIALPNKDQLKFHSYKDAKLLMEAIKKRLQKLIGQLEVQGEVLEQEDINLKLLRSLPSEWKTHALIWRNKEEIETISLDDLYNSLKIYEPELSGSSNTSQNPQNVAFVSSNSNNSTSSTNEANNTTYGVSAAHTQGNSVNSTSVDNLSDAVIYAFLASQPNSPQLAQEDLEQIDSDDLEEMDLQWEMAMLTIRARRFIKRTGRKLDINDQRIGFDSYQAEEEHPINFALIAYTSSGSSSSSDSEVDSCSKSCVKAYATLKEQYDKLASDYRKSQINVASYKFGLESVEERLEVYKKNEAIYEEDIKILKIDVKLRDKVLAQHRQRFETAKKERDELKLKLEKFQTSSKNLNNLRRRAVSTGSSGVSTASRIISTAEETVSTAGASMPVSTADMLKETQERAGYEAAIRLQEQLDEEETYRIARDAEIVQRLQEEIDAAERQRMAQVHQAAQGEDEQQSAEEKGLSKEELQNLLVIVPVEEVYVEALQKLDREDLVKLWDLVKERFSTTEPTDDKEKELWVKLKRLFKPDDDDILRKLQRYMHNPVIWRLYDTCGVHHVSTTRGHDIFMLVEKDYPLTRGLMAVMLANKLQVDESSKMANELLRKIFYQANRPRQ
ncbi:hypothetical protein Tco_0175041 [Tanacetum coccineum]